MEKLILIKQKIFVYLLLLQKKLNYEKKTTIDLFLYTREIKGKELVGYIDPIEDEIANINNKETIKLQKTIQ